MAQSATSSEGEVRTHRVEDPGQAAEALRELDRYPWIGLDLETAPLGPAPTARYVPGLDPFLSRIRLVQLATEKDAFVLDTTRTDPAPWYRWMEAHAERLIAHNGRFDLAHLQRAGVFLTRIWDTMLSEQLLRVGEGGRTSLADVAQRHLGVTLDKTLQTSDFGRELTDAQFAYAGKDAAILPSLRTVMAGRLEQKGLKRTALLEFAAVPAFAMLSRSGFVLYQDRWAEITRETEQELVQLERDLHELLPAPARQARLFGSEDASGLNLSSPAQVKEALARLGVQLDSTDEHHLKAVDHPVTRLLLKHRELSTRLKMFLRPIPGLIHPETGRLHAEYWQVAAASGRTASSNPNIQQIPRDAALRDCFRASVGHRLVIADYSQVELRIAAEDSGDSTMIAAFVRGEDIHRRTAALVTGKAPADVTKAERQLAKAVNFGLVYGMGAGGLVRYARDSYGVAMTMSEAEAFRRRYFEAYPGIAAWHRRQLEKARRDGGIRTAAGRWRPLAEPTVTLAANSPTQGTGADLLKTALGAIAPEAFRRGWELVAEVHDEIVLEVPEGETDEARRALTEAMVKAGHRFLKRVPVEAEAGTGMTWAEK